MLIMALRYVLADHLKRFNETVELSPAVCKKITFVILVLDRVKHVGLAALTAVRVIHAAETKYSVHRLSFLPTHNNYAWPLGVVQMCKTNM